MLRRITAVLAATLIAASCSDQPAPMETALSPSEAEMARQGATVNSTLLTNIPIEGTLETGDAFTGTLSITEFAVNSAGELLASGTILDEAGDLVGTFTGVLANLLEGGDGGACDILFLDLGPIFLDVLGLQLDVSQITIDLTAQSGPGNLLGNLLCTVAHLLDNGGPVAGLLNLVNQINSLLA